MNDFNLKAVLFLIKINKFAVFSVSKLKELIQLSVVSQTGLGFGPKFLTSSKENWVIFNFYLKNA